MSNHVIIKGKNDRLVIALNPDIDFLDLCDILKTKILEAKDFIGNSRMAIEFSGRTLTNINRDFHMNPNVSTPHTIRCVPACGTEPPG